LIDKETNIELFQCWKSSFEGGLVTWLYHDHA
jgi:hypothetical protein